MTIFAVIPTHNRRDILAKCLKGLRAQTLPVIIVIGDGGSSDGTAEMIASQFPDAIHCQGPDTLWWTGSINLAVRSVLQRCTREDYVICMNDDTEIASDYVAKLLNAAGSKGDTLVGSVCVDINAPDIIIDGGNRMNWYTAKYRKLNRGRLLSEFPANHTETVDVLPGRGMLIPARAFLDLGLFAERALPQYAADGEFAARCALAGYRLIVSYDAVVRSWSNLTGTHGSSGGFSWTHLRKLLFDRRSSLRIQDRFYFAWLTRRSIPQALLFFLLSLVRILGHHAVDWWQSERERQKNP